VLHLKPAATALPDGTFLMAPRLVSAGLFPAVRSVEEKAGGEGSPVRYMPRCAPPYVSSPSLASVLTARSGTVPAWRRAWKPPNKPRHGRETGQRYAARRLAGPPSPSATPMATVCPDPLAAQESAEFMGVLRLHFTNSPE
jgi:hypothetical protein